MRPFTRDHPHVRSPPGVMSCEEIRYWIRELHTNPQWGWAHHPGALASALGVAGEKPGHAVGTLLGKIRERKQAWIYPGEQLRFSKQLRLILAGVLVCRNVGPRASSWSAVVASNPKPLRTPMRMQYDLATGRLGFTRVVAPERARVLPSFADIFSGVKTWVPPPR